MMLPPIEQLIPHRGPMRLIERVIAADGPHVRAAATVSHQGPFCTPDGVPIWVGVEYMAQTIAVWAGLRAHAQGLPPPLGFLLGTRRYSCTRTYLPAGAELVIDANCEIIGENGLAAFNCRILLQQQTVAEAMLSVFQPPDAQAFMESDIA